MSSFAGCFLTIFCIYFQSFYGFLIRGASMLAGFCVVCVFSGVFSNRRGLKSQIISFLVLIIKLFLVSLAFLTFKSIKRLTFNFVYRNLHYFLKLFRDFLKIVYCCRNIFISSKITFQSA